MDNILDSLIDFCNNNGLGLSKINIDADNSVGIAVASRGSLLFKLTYSHPRWVITELKEKVKCRNTRVVCLAR